MKNIHLLLVIAVLCALSIDCFAQVDSNKVTRNTLVGAIRKVQADSLKTDTLNADIGINTPHNTQESIGLSKDTLVCNNHTTSIVLFVYNPYNESDKPYSIKYSKNGMLLEIYHEGIVVFRKTYEYDGITFQKLLSVINLQQLVSTVPYGKMVSGKSSTTLSIYQNEICCFTANDNMGILNVKGSFEPLIQYLQNLIPDLQSIIEKCEEGTPNTDN